MTGNEYQKLAARTINKSLSKTENEKHAMLGLFSEIGELSGLYQKVYQGHKLDDKHLKSELGDVLWFVAEFCTAKDWRLEDVMQANITKLKARYPEGFDAEHSLHRKDGDV